MNLLKTVSLLLISLLALQLPVDTVANDRPSIRDLELIDQFGKPFNFEKTDGKVGLVVFGYTSCPDVCPMSLTIVGNILKNLGNDADKVAAILLSVDPVRDRPEVLRSYVSWFHKDIIGLTGSKEQIDAAMQAFSAHYSLRKKSNDDTNYLVDHSSGFYLIDREGKLAQIIPFGLPSEHILQAIRRLISDTP